MTKKEIHQEALEVVRRERRDSNIVYLVEVYEHFVKAVTTVGINTRELKDGIKKILYANPKNPLNAILGVLGLQIVSKNKAKKIVESKNLSESELGNLLSLDVEKLTEIAHNLTLVLIKTEHELIEERENKVRELNDLITKIELRDKEISQLKTDTRSTLQAFAVRMQYMLSIIKAEGNQNSLEDQLLEMIKDYEIEVYWYNTNSEPNLMMFKELKTDDLTKQRDKPCLMYHDEVLAMGLYFTL